MLQQHRDAVTGQHKVAWRSAQAIEDSLRRLRRSEHNDGITGPARQSTVWCHLGCEVRKAAAVANARQICRLVLTQHMQRALQQWLVFSNGSSQRCLSLGRAACPLLHHHHHMSATQDNGQGRQQGSHLLSYHSKVVILV